MNTTLIIPFLLSLLLGIGLTLFTYLYTSAITSKVSSYISLSEASARSYSIFTKAGDTIIIKGNSTNPVDIYIISPEIVPLANSVTSFRISFLSHINGNLYIQFRTLPYTNLTKVSLEILVINTWFEGIGYLISALFIIISLFTFGYYRSLSKSVRRVKKR
ncbi:hypothetical protein DJ528_11135 [Sulfolobus sp. B5]|nr:hypothetical protein DJ528_11135 [Sulfolobus sp. B5]